MPLLAINPPLHPWSGSALMVEARGIAPRSSPHQHKSFIAIAAIARDKTYICDDGTKVKS